MQKDQRNLLASLALAGTVIAGIAGAAAVSGFNDDAFMKMNTLTTASGAFDKFNVSAPMYDATIKFDLS